MLHGQIGAIRHLRRELAREAFGENRPWVIGTGGFAWLFEREALFDEIIPEFVLLGLKHAELLKRE